MVSVPPLLWVAYWPDFSDLVVFTNELAALRYAVENVGMSVGCVRAGLPLREQLR